MFINEKVFGIPEWNIGDVNLVKPAISSKPVVTPLVADKPYCDCLHCQ